MVLANSYAVGGAAAQLCRMESSASAPIYLAKYFYLSLYLYYIRILKYINYKKPNKDFVLIYIFCLVCLINK